MRISPSRPIDDEAGMALIEVLIALAIFGLALLAIGLSLPGLRSYGAGTGFDTRVEAFLRAARYQAQLRQEAVEVIFDGHSLAMIPPFERALPVAGSAARIELVAARELGDRRTGKVVFLPDGRSSGGEFRLSIGATVRRLEIGWANSLVRWHD